MTENKAREPIAREPTREKKIDFSNLDKSRLLAKRNKEYLNLLSTVEKALRGMQGEHASLKSRPARGAAMQLLRQFDLILNMVQLPYVILMMAEGTRQGYSEALRVVIREILKGFVQGSPKEGTTEKDQKKEDEKEEKEKARKKAFSKSANHAMKYFFALDSSGALSRPWLSAVTVYTWTAFECLSGDLWVNALNTDTSLAHRTLNSIPKEDGEETGLSRRQIDVGLAARHGFDLRRSLGTLLKSKFDFSSVEGVASAYKQAFGTLGDLEEFMPPLKQLEQVRHLVVHRGGVTDEKFLRLTKLKAKRGFPLPLRVSQVTEYMVGATMACVALLRVVDHAMCAEHRQIEGRAPQAASYGPAAWPRSAWRGL